ncbi:MAG: L-threonine 3-dehydrogenase [Opitutales bacterium]|jgi:threonine 3-dehydrogenase
MRAIVKETAGPGLAMMEMPVPEPGPDDVLIRILKTSICGTDVHIDTWDAWASRTIKPPMIIGHEFVGEIVHMGDHVRGLKKGEIVSGEGHLVCGKCRNCLSGRMHLCPHTYGVGVNRQGAFADYLCLPRTNVWPVNPAIPLEIASCFDPLGNAVHTATYYDVLGEDVLITGAGPIGCMAAAICRHAGARSVVVTDVNPYRLELARAMGATVALDVSKDSLLETEKLLDVKEGFDVGLEMSGNPAALSQMIDVMFSGGRIALLGILPPDAPVDWTRIIFKGLNLKGIYGRKMYETWYKMSVLLRGGLKIDPVITHRFPAESFREAFDLMESGQSGKIILEWNE